MPAYRAPYVMPGAAGDLAADTVRRYGA